MPTKPPTEGAIAIGGVVIGTFGIAAAVLSPPINLAALIVAATLALGLVGWYAIGGRAERRARAESERIELEASRRAIAALTESLKDRAESAKEVLAKLDPQPEGPVAIHIEGGRGGMIRGNTFGRGFRRDIEAIDHDDLTVEGNIHGASTEHGFSGAVGRNIVCKCGFEAPTKPDFDAHLAAVSR